MKESKGQIKEEYYKKLIDYESQQNEIKSIEWQRDMKEKVLDREK